MGAMLDGYLEYLRVLTHGKAEQVLAQPDLADPVGLRDRAILETFYSTGMRRRELAQLELYDLDCERRTVMVRQGKGKKDRMVPIGKRALAWIEKYLAESRPLLQTDHREPALFLSSLGLPLEPDSLTEYVRDYEAKANTGKTGSCHLFRHTMATLMLENGADIRFIQPRRTLDDANLHAGQHQEAAGSPRGHPSGQGETDRKDC